MKDSYNDELIHLLINKIKMGDVKAKEKFIALHKAFVQAAIHRFKTITTIPTDELLRAANTGLIRAAIYFEKGYDFPFMSYAIWFINKRIIEQIHGLHPRVI